MKKTKYSEVADTLKVLSNAKRLQILDVVSKKEVSVNGISEVIGTRKSNTSQHLAILKYLGLVEMRRFGKNVFYQTTPKIRKVIRFLLSK